MRVFKYPLDAVDQQIIMLPVGSRILTVQVQHGEPRLWAAVNQNYDRMQKFEIGIYGTGCPMPDDPGTYISTIQLHGGHLVFHVFFKQQEQS